MLSSTASLIVAEDPTPEPAPEEAAYVETASHKQPVEATPSAADATGMTAQAWFALGSRVAFDRRNKRIVAVDDAANSPDIAPELAPELVPELVKVHRRVVKAAATDEDAVWTSFLPGWPDGSFGWAKVDGHLSRTDAGPKLFVEYVGHGDSDKPADYAYGTLERADLVEAMWAAEAIRSTFIVAFDYSSIVVLELLSRQHDRLERGEEPATRIEGVLLINGGLFVDAHSHPWFTTPVLKSRLGGLVTSLAQRSRFAFGELMKPLWSKEFGVTRAEIDQLYDAIGRRNGVFALSKSASFVDQHKRNAERWDLGRLFHALKDTVSFHIVGSAQDPFEGRQAIAARDRLGKHGLDVRIVPGGHLTTSERPELLAQIIEEVGPGAGGE